MHRPFRQFLCLLLALSGWVAASPRPEFSLRGTVGANHWAWNEELETAPDLEERGWIPSTELRVGFRQGFVSAGASWEGMTGAIDYDGYLQDVQSETLTPYLGSTYYAYSGVGVWAHLLARRPGYTVFFGGRFEQPSWRRTIDSERDNRPGIHGYVEVWSFRQMGPDLGLELDLPRGGVAALHGAWLFPLGPAREVIGRMTLAPRTNVGYRGELSWRMSSGLVFEVATTAVGFGQSPLVRHPQDMFLVVSQPPSVLRAWALRVGWQI